LFEYPVDQIGFSDLKQSLLPLLYYLWMGLWFKPPNTMHYYYKSLKMIENNSKTLVCRTSVFRCSGYRL